MTPEPPPAASLPSLSFPVAGARFVCPNCGAPRVFQSQQAEVNDPLARPAICACGRLLGYYVVGAGRMTLLRLAGPV